MTVRRHFRLFPLLAAIAWPAAALAAGPVEDAVHVPAGVETIVEADATVRGRVAGAQGRPLRRCQPRDLMLHIAKYCAYQQLPLEMTREHLDRAARCYFTVVSGN